MKLSEQINRMADLTQTGERLSRARSRGQMADSQKADWTQRMGAIQIADMSAIIHDMNHLQGRETKTQMSVRGEPVAR